MGWILEEGPFRPYGSRGNAGNCKAEWCGVDTGKCDGDAGWRWSAYLCFAEYRGPYAVVVTVEFDRVGAAGVWPDDTLSESTDDGALHPTLRYVLFGII